MYTDKVKKGTAYYHLPGLFEFYELYRMFLSLYHEHREYFYDWCEIGSIYGAPADCLWGGGRAGFGEYNPQEVLKLMQEYGITARLTFSNSLLRKQHLLDKKCNMLCTLFEKKRRCEKWCDFSFGVVIRLLEKELSWVLFCFLDHQGSDRILATGK